MGSSRRAAKQEANCMSLIFPKTLLTISETSGHVSFHTSTALFRVLASFTFGSLYDMFADGSGGVLTKSVSLPQGARRID